MEVINIPLGFFHIYEVSESHGEVIIHNNDIIIQKNNNYEYGLDI